MQKNFGYPGTFMDLILRITLVWFPFVEPKRSGMSTSAPLTDLEESLATLYFLKHASSSCDQKHLQAAWGLTKFKYVRTHARTHARTRARTNATGARKCSRSGAHDGKTWPRRIASWRLQVTSISLIHNNPVVSPKSTVAA